jgi:hypothetical protein
MNYLYVKLALIMGLSWLVYVVCMSVTEICLRAPPEIIVAQVFVLIGAIQVNVQGTCVVMCLFWGSVYEKFFARNKKQKNGAQNNENNNNNNYHMQQLNMQQQQQMNLQQIHNRNYHQRISVF